LNAPIQSSHLNDEQQVSNALDASVDALKQFCPMLMHLNATHITKAIKEVASISFQT